MDFLPPGLIASGPHNKVWRLRLQQQRRLAGPAPEPSPASVASFRGLGESVVRGGEGDSILGPLWLFAIFGTVGYFALRHDEKKRRERRK